SSVEEFVANNNAGEPAVRLVTTSYIRSDLRDSARRPVIFLFNGGPSAAAIGVHMQFGPMRGKGKDPGAVGYTPSPTGATEFENNPDSLIDVADLVMFDPAETGFSRVLRESDRAYFYSTEGDGDSLAQLVVSWTQRHGRTQSPIYFLGESY